MNKIEFLNNLRTALSLELPASEIESNIQFYDEYITTSMTKKSEEEILNELGDPRLIAKTLIETYQISHGTSYSGHRSEYRENQTNDTNEYYNQSRETSSSEENKAYFNLNSSIKWYHKLILCIIVIVFFVLIFFLGSIAIRVFFNFGLPILIVYFGYKFITNNIRRR